MILMIDNYDSFTYNLYQYIGSLNEDIQVIRNDKITVREIAAKQPSHIVISPGPGYPVKAGISIETVKTFYDTVPILGVCLGHQSVGEAFGGRTVQAKALFHGKSSDIYLRESPIFSGMPRKMKGARYHSLIVEREGLPDELEIIAQTEDGEIMGLAHKQHPVFGIQFHPESIITEHGMDIIRNFLKIKGRAS